MIDEFAKFDGNKGLNLDEAVREAEQAVADADTWEEVMRALAELMSGACATELDGFYPYSFQIGDRFYYPAKGTTRRLPTGWIIFKDDSGAYHEESWMTVQHCEIKAVRWFPDNAAEEVEAAKAA